ncbi:RNA dependent RNA polymerase [Lacrimispora brassicae]
MNDSQILRWICQLNGIHDLDGEVKNIKAELRRIKKEPKNRENKDKIAKLYDKLFSLQYQKDYFCMIMNSGRDYDKANAGFKINGYSYHRLLGTNGGIKKSTITYVGSNVFEEIKKRMDNGRDKTKKIVPAKLEAYQALICSGSVPVTMPKILIVKDCTVRFNEDVIRINDENDGEPELTYEKDYEIEYCDSDGYGLMSPEYSRIVNRDLYGEEYKNQTISGINTRYAWTKGMLFTFDFVEFARRINHGTYMVKDAWGQQKDIRNYDVILTTSMVKLWDSYDSLEHFIQCSQENQYQFSVTKTTPHKLENVRNSNYQFLQTYDFTEEELYRLCKPTIDEITGAMGGDWRKTIVFLKGMYLNEDNVDFIENDFIKALMIDKRMLDDPFVIKKIHGMIKKRIEMAAKGSILLKGNFAIVSGDPYSLAQSILGLPVTGLLKPGEVYHKYWIHKDSEELACFRAPMTCHNNIRKRKVVHNEEMDFWYQYITTGIILNSWDTTCDALNGADKDSDAFFTTDDEIILENTLNSPTIQCMQRKAEKIIPTESDIVQANKLAFGDEIGSTTNRITSMIELQSTFEKDTEEFKALNYRIMCGQHYQQNSIDKAKGILAKPMPRYWYDKAACNKLPESTDKEKEFKELCLRIVADKKPYFMRYVYPDLMTQYHKYVKDAGNKCIRLFKMTLADLIVKPHKTIPEQEFMEYYHKLMPVGNQPCTVNRICKLFEDTFKDYPKQCTIQKTFDYSILKSNVGYGRQDYKEVEKIKSEYDDYVRAYQQQAKKQRLDKEEVNANRAILLLEFKQLCEKICPDQKELCDIIIDMCYSNPKSKKFAWDMCGGTIIENLLKNNSFIINYPVRVDEHGEFEFSGEEFVMCKKRYREDEELL